MACTQYLLRWRKHAKHFEDSLSNFIDRQALCDITLACDGKLFKAHQFVLSACSPYFEKMFMDIPTNTYPIIFLQNVSSAEISCLLDYIYKGQACLPQDLMPAFLKTCESLQIQGFCETSNSQEISKNNDDRHIAENYPNGNVCSEEYESGETLERNMSKQKCNNYNRKSISQEPLFRRRERERLENNHSSSDIFHSVPVAVPDVNRMEIGESSIQNTSLQEVQVDNFDVLNSPPHISENSFVFSLDNNFNVPKANEFSKSIVIQEHSLEILEISDDNDVTPSVPNITVQTEPINTSIDLENMVVDVNQVTESIENNQQRTATNLTSFVENCDFKINMVELEVDTQNNFNNTSTTNKEHENSQHSDQDFELILSSGGSDYLECQSDESEVIIRCSKKCASNKKRELTKENEVQQEHIAENNSKLIKGTEGNCRKGKAQNLKAEAIICAQNMKILLGGTSTEESRLKDIDSSTQQNNKRRKYSKKTIDLVDDGNHPEKDAHADNVS